MISVFDKLHAARINLALSQKEAALQASIKPVAISLLERGQKHFIPTLYIQFLLKKGIDLHWLFDENDQRTGLFSEVPNQEKPPIKQPPHKFDSSTSEIHQSLNEKNQQPAS